jgi:hypothetical protein
MAAFLLSALGIIILFTQISHEVFGQTNAANYISEVAIIRAPEVEGRSVCVHYISFIMLSLTMHSGCRIYHFPLDLNIVQFAHTT